MLRTKAGHDDANRGSALVQVLVGAVTTGAHPACLGHLRSLTDPKQPNRPPERRQPGFGRAVPSAPRRP